MNNSPLWSAADWSFWRSDYQPDLYYRFLRDCGIDAVEMVPPERRSAARKAGLRLLNLSGPGMQQGLNHREHHVPLLPAIRSAIAEASKDGIAQVILFSGNRIGQAHADGIAQCVEGLSKLAPIAEQAGVTLLLEVLNSYDHVDYAADHTHYVAEVVRTVNSPRVRMLYDVYHMAKMGQDVVCDLQRHLPLIGHLHVAEPPDRTVPCAGGTVPWRALMKQVSQDGYAGHWGLEFCRRDGEALNQIPAALASF